MYKRQGKRLFAMIMVAVMILTIAPEVFGVCVEAASSAWKVLHNPQLVVDELYGERNNIIFGIKDGNVAIVDDSMKLVSKTKYDQYESEDMIHGDGLLVSKKGSGKKREYAVIDKNGKDIVNFGVHDSLRELYYANTESTYLAKDTIEGEIHYSLVDRTGKIRVSNENTYYEYNYNIDVPFTFGKKINGQMRYAIYRGFDAITGYDYVKITRSGSLLAGEKTDGKVGFITGKGELAFNKAPAGYDSKYFLGTSFDYAGSIYYTKIFCKSQTEYDIVNNLNLRLDEDVSRLFELKKDTKNYHITFYDENGNNVEVKEPIAIAGTMEYEINAEEGKKRSEDGCLVARMITTEDGYTIIEYGEDTFYYKKEWLYNSERRNYGIREILKDNSGNILVDTTNTWTEKEYGGDQSHIIFFSEAKTIVTMDKLWNGDSTIIDDDAEQEIIVGTILEDAGKKCKVKVTSVKEGKLTVSYLNSTDEKAKSIIIPDSVKVDGIAYKVTHVADNALAKNKKVTQITVGKNVVSIGKNAFKNCTSLKSVNIKSTVLNKIGASAFYGDKNLTTITLKTTKLTQNSIGTNVLKGTNKKLTIKVPKKKESVYKTYFKNKGNKSVQVK